MGTVVLAAVGYYVVLAVLAAAGWTQRRRILAAPTERDDAAPLGLLETALLYGGRRRAAEAVVADLYERGDMDCAYNGWLTVRPNLPADGPARTAVLNALSGRRAAAFPELARAIGASASVREAEEALVRGGLLTPRRRLTRMRAFVAAAATLAFAGGTVVFGIAAETVAGGVPPHDVPLVVLLAMLPLLTGLAALGTAAFYTYVRLADDLRLTTRGRAELDAPPSPKRLGVLTAREGYTGLPEGALREAMRPGTTQAPAWQYHRNWMRLTS